MVELVEVVVGRVVDRVVEGRVVVVVGRVLGRRWQKFV